MSPKNTPASVAKAAQDRRDAAWRATLGSVVQLPGTTLRTAGDLGIALLVADGGLCVRSLYDLRLKRELVVDSAAPLFSLTLRDAAHGEVSLSAESGWGSVSVSNARACLILRWQQPLDARLDGVSVTATATADARQHAWRWQFDVECSDTPWSVWRVTFPQLSFARFDDRAVVLVPSGPGELKRNAWDAVWSYQEAYGQAWCAMQLMAVYAESDQPTGLYVAHHDPFGSAKDLSAESDPSTQRVTLAMTHPAPDMGIPGNGYQMGGEVVWQLLRGDWFDAAMIYKAWASCNAHWWPELTADGRADTPAWMRELSVWVQEGFEAGTTRGKAPQETTAPVRRFRQFMGVPVGVHMYAWHHIPFDNDYPHYFPAKPGFAESVSELQADGVYLMPYINGRLWDTRDRGIEDYEFTRIALPAATKDEHGQPYVESYGSQEADGSPVKLAVMCPATSVWQTRVKDIVMRLVEEIGVDGVYIDQVAAAKPMPCLDPSHGHVLGGGHWWNDGYWQMLDAIQAALPTGRMITTECNAEAFIRWFDGYLTWHWQHDGMVPVFPAIYAGTVQTFGRSYGNVSSLAVRMKAAQQFVFGEQIGWFNPAVIDDPANAEFIRQLVRLRWQLRRYFYAGQMARPPQLLGDIPKVRADWQWNGECWVTADAVFTAAWRLPDQGKMIIQLVNVDDAPVHVSVVLDRHQYGLLSRVVSMATVNPEGKRSVTASLPKDPRIPIVLEPHEIRVVELAWPCPH